MANGMTLIVPTSVTTSGGLSAAISASGTVTYSNLTSTQPLSLNGVFTSTYRNYAVYLSSVMTGSDTFYEIRLRAAGSDATGTDYNVQYWGYTSSQYIGRLTGGTRWYATENGAGRQGCVMLFYGPQLAEQTSYHHFGSSERSSVTHTMNMGNHDASTSYDGFTIYPNGVTADDDGTISVYGFNE